MASSSTPCRNCDRSRRIFCDYHLAEQQRHWTEQIDRVNTEFAHLSEILALPPSYESLTESTELLHKVDQWEMDTVRQVKEAAEKIKEKVRQRSDTVATERFQPEFHRLTEALNQSQQSNHSNDSDLQQLTRQLTDLKLQIEDSLLSNADIRVKPIDWSQYIQVITKPPAVRRYQPRLNFENLLSTRSLVSLDVKGFDWHILGSVSTVNSAFLHYQHSRNSKRLSLVHIDGQRTPIPWSKDQSIWDSCWSVYLNKFLILADTRLYTYDETLVSSPIQWIENVQTKRDKMEFLRCACSDETMFVTYDERNSSVDEYNMQQWTLVRHHEDLVRKNEIISSLACSETNSNLIGMTILDDRQHWHFELRDRALLLISSVPLDKSEFNRRLISLPSSSTNWLIVHTGTKFLTVIDENGQSKRMIECAENIDLATYSTEKNCLILLTQKSKLKFFDL